LPAWRQQAQREREAELIFRGEQYARAIALFQRKYANTFPPNVDVLLNEHFLRKKYKDPMTDGDFQIVYANQQAAAQPSAGGTVPTQGQPAQRPASVVAGATPVAQGGIVGVVSKSTEQSLRLFNGRGKYSEWVFTPETLGIRMPGAGGPNTQGGPAGAFGPDGRPLGPGTGPSRGQSPFDRMRGGPQQPGQPMQPNQPRPFGLPAPRPPG